MTVLAVKMFFRLQEVRLDVSACQCSLCLAFRRYAPVAFATIQSVPMAMS